MLCHSHTQSDSHHTLSKQPICRTCEAVTSRTECQHQRGQKMSEQCQKEKTLQNGCHGRRLGLCPVYLSLFLTATFLSVLTPCQPHLAGALWVAGRRPRWRYTKQAGWMGLTGLGSNGASLPDADNSGARGRGLKPEATAWYFKRPEWLWSQLSINRCTQSGKNKTLNSGKNLDDDRGKYWQIFFFLFSEAILRFTFRSFHTHHKTAHTHTNTHSTIHFRPRLLLTDYRLHCLKCLEKGWRKVCVCAVGSSIHYVMLSPFQAAVALHVCCTVCVSVVCACIHIPQTSTAADSAPSSFHKHLHHFVRKERACLFFCSLLWHLTDIWGEGVWWCSFWKPGAVCWEWQIVKTHAKDIIPVCITEVDEASPVPASPPFCLCAPPYASTSFFLICRSLCCPTCPPDALIVFAMSSLLSPFD